ncbi:MAG: helix-turn-helix transcriptional regulator [Candidatus Aminicenantes bacterium]|jgi:transcriptional regulator with XRE-family HTH domain|nr:helix-turn-helix transcriptional regulator [Candidatus Aminicenantes bacterium]
MTTETLGDRLRIIRKFLGLNQEVISQKLQITNQTLSRYEKNVRFPDSLFLRRFGILFNVNANWLLYGIGDMFIEDTDRSPDSKQDKLKKLRYFLAKIEELLIETKEES